MINGYLSIAFFIYIFLLTAIALYFSYRSKSASDFALGGRSSHYFVTAIATQASDMSSWLMLAFPAAVYLRGFQEIPTAIGLIFFMFLSWHFIAPRLRIISEKYQSHTLSSLFSTYFNDTSNYLRITSGIISLYFFTCYLASGLVGLGNVFESIFQIPYHAGIAIGLGITLLYTIFGGFISVSWSNTFQGIFLLLMIILVPFYSFFSFEYNPETVIHCFSDSHIPTESELISALFLSIGWGIGYFGQPHILTYFMGIDDPKNIRYAKYVGMIWQMCALGAATAIGLLAIRYLGPEVEKPELLFVIFSQKMFHPMLVGFILCAILAATLTTMSSHILISGSVCAFDLYKPLFPKSDEKRLLFVSRLSATISSGVATLIAWSNSTTIYNLVSYAWSGLGSSFGPLVIALLLKKRISTSAALETIITGALIAAIWPLFNQSIMPLIPGFIASWIIIEFHIFKKRKTYC